MNYPKLQAEDSEIYEIIKAEEQRQTEGLELIASENYVSPVILETISSVLTNKYSEGYIGKRYYGGNEVVDRLEAVAIERAKKLFGAEHANVQPHSGAPANMAAFWALLQPGDKVLSLSLAQGGHLTHGSPVNFSGKLYNIVSYTLDRETGRINMDEVEEIALREKPKMILAGYTCYTRDIDWKRFKEIADKVGAFTMADIAHPAGLIASGVLESPVPYFDVVTSTSHKTLRGPRGAFILCKAQFAKQIDKAVFPGMQGGPHDHTIAAKAVAFKEAMQPEFKEYCQQIIKNSRVLAAALAEKGYKLISGGTDNHIVWIDVFGSKGLTGQEAEHALELVGISINKNMIPYDTRKPLDPSGIRIGTPAMTTRGLKEKEMQVVADLIDAAILNRSDSAGLEKIKREVIDLASKFPVPGIN